MAAHSDANPSSEGDAAPGASILFDGVSSEEWRMSTIENQPGQDDPGHFSVEEGLLVAHPGTDLGLLWHRTPTPPNFLLELDWRTSSLEDNSGIFLRFPDPRSKGYNNTAWVAIDFGFEVQINDIGFPDGAPEHTTGALYGQSNQVFSSQQSNQTGTWNNFKIIVQGQSYKILLNDLEAAAFENLDTQRGLPTTAEAASYIGLQTHTGIVSFRNIRITALP